MRTIILAVTLACAGLLVPSAEAQVYNLHLATDQQPDYTDIKSFVESSTGAWQTPEEKAIAVWRWGRRSRRQTSCAVEAGRTILDPIQHYNSYGAMNCGIISALNIDSWVELDYKARYIQLGDHTVSEVSWDDGKTWHLFDSSMSFYCFNHTGQIASCDEIKQALACELSGGKAEPGHYYLYHGAPQVRSHLGPTGWRSAGDNPVEYNRTLFEGADSYLHKPSVDRYCQYSRTAHRYTLNLRSHESYTRYWKPLDKNPEFFRPMPDGKDPDDQHNLHNIRGNGQWSFAPDLSDKECDKLFYDSSGIAHDRAAGAPHLSPSQTGQAGWVSFQVSAANVITSLRIDAQGQCADAKDALKLLVSRNAGISWKEVWRAEKAGSQQIQLNLREEVAGVTQCWIKFEMLAATAAQNVGLNSLRISTITQLNRRTLPALALGSNQVLLRADQQAQTVELWPALHGGVYKESVFDEKDTFSDKQPDGIYKATLGAGVNNQPGSVTWRLAVPTDITDVTYAVVSTLRSRNGYVSLQNSWDGKRFDEFNRRSDDGFPMDRQVFRTFGGGDVPAGSREAYLRGTFFCSNGAGNYSMPGIQDVLVRVHHKPRDSQFRPIEVSYNWTEHRENGDVTRSHTELVPSLPHRCSINVAGRRDPTMNWVRLRLKGSGPEGEKVVYGYGDGVDVGPGAGYAKLSYHWGQSLADGKLYTASRPSSASSGNPDTAGRELTNGIIIAPTEYMATKAVQAATAFWDAGEPVTFVVDLGKAQTIGAARVSTHQPNARFCHPAKIEVAVSTDGQSWQPAATARHDDLWKPPGDYEPWEHDDNPKYASLPAGGRLAYSYPLAFRQPLEGRYVRIVCTPLDGKGMGLSEFQVFDRVDVRPWPAEIYLPK